MGLTAVFFEFLGIKSAFDWCCGKLAIYGVATLPTLALIAVVAVLVTVFGLGWILLTVTTFEAFDTAVGYVPDSKDSLDESEKAQ